MAYVTYQTVLPAYQGTKNLADKFSDRLLCVRYNRCKQFSSKIKTAEIILHERDCNESARHIPYNKIVDVKVEYGEI